MRVQVPHDAQIAGGLRVAGFSYLYAHSPVCFPVPAAARQIPGHRRSPARFPATAVAPPDLRLPRGLPARSPSAPRASLGASARSPARPARPRGSLQSGGLSCCFPSLSQASTPHAIQNSPSTRTSPISRPCFMSGHSKVIECTAKHMGITRMRCARAL